ncbi:MAG: PHP domain-containing protein [Firmicutes bacterium]|nr:PHP domain-containing protein [Bacillota bacterium]
MAVDLHVHSTASDGRYSPKELVRLAFDRNVKTIALTDHDTVDGVQEAVLAGMELGVRVIPGVELSTDVEEAEVHVLGYHVDTSSATFLGTLHMLRQGRIARAERILEKLSKLGIKISLPYVLSLGKEGFVGRSQVFRAMVNLGYARPERRYGDFEKYLGKEGLAYVEHYGLTPTEAVRLVLAARGVPVLAHPGRTAGEALLEDLIEAGLEGIEAYYPAHDSELTRRWIEVARRHGLIVTGGSDFHGVAPDEPAVLGGVSVPDSVVDDLDRRRRELAADGDGGDRSGVSKTQ